ncbi:MAG: ABC transporter permease [Planctomycetes bacterium]|nr:ABC transporter permease [Planctomycetota bacterium]
MGRATGHPLLELTRARILETVREPEAVFWVFVFPVILALVLGIAFRGPGDEAPRVVLTGPGAEALAARLGGAPGAPAATWTRAGEAEAAAAARKGKADLVVRVGEAAAGPPPVVFRFDPSRPGARAARLEAESAIQAAFGRADPVPATEEIVSERGGRYIDFLIPGLIGLNVMGSCLWGMGYAIVDDRRRKLLKRFAVTPLVRSHFLLAYALSRLVFLAAQVALLAFFGAVAFGVRIQGSVLWLAAAALAGTLAFSGLALLISCRTENTETASGWMNFVQLPMWLLSGSFFSYERFPEALHPFIRLLPLTALNDALRAVANEGAGPRAIAAPLALLCGWGLASFAVALRLFRWQ